MLLPSNITNACTSMQVERLGNVELCKQDLLFLHKCPVPGAAGSEVTTSKKKISHSRTSSNGCSRGQQRQRKKIDKYINVKTWGENS